jgi:hypothetical protein
VANPSVKIASFSTLPLGGDDPEDISFNPVNGHLFIANGSDISHPKIIEIDSSGTQVIRNRAKCQRGGMAPFIRAK